MYKERQGFLGGKEINFVVVGGGVYCYLPLLSTTLARHAVLMKERGGKYKIGPAKSSQKRGDSLLSRSGNAHFPSLSSTRGSLFIILRKRSRGFLPLPILSQLFSSLLPPPSEVGCGGRGGGAGRLREQSQLEEAGRGVIQPQVRQFCALSR